MNCANGGGGGGPRRAIGRGRIRRMPETAGPLRRRSREAAEGRRVESGDCRAPASDIDGEKSLARRQVAHGRPGWGESVCKRTAEGQTSGGGEDPSADRGH